MSFVSPSSATKSSFENEAEYQSKNETPKSSVCHGVELSNDPIVKKPPKHQKYQNQEEKRQMNSKEDDAVFIGESPSPVDKAKTKCFHFTDFTEKESKSSTAETSYSSLSAGNVFDEDLEELELELAELARNMSSDSSSFDRHTNRQFSTQSQFDRNAMLMSHHRDTGLYKSTSLNPHLSSVSTGSISSEVFSPNDGKEFFEGVHNEADEDEYRKKKNASRTSAD